jgi:HTH-type transcriptional regulator / antitoxin HipB
MKAKNPETFNEYLDKKYGKEGTPEREAFNERAQAYMVAEMLKDARNT